MFRSLIQRNSLIAPVRATLRSSLSTAAAAAEPAMFCYQCEQTKDQKGCTTVGVCGKDSSTAALQDLQLHFNIGLAQWAHAIEGKGGKVSDNAKDLILDSTFATLTNVNFDNTRFYDYLRRADAVRTELMSQAKALNVDDSQLTGPARFQFRDNQDFLTLEAKAHGILAKRRENLHEDILGVREMSQYGIKGTMAYFAHAERVRNQLNKNAYTDAQRDEVYSKLFQTLARLSPSRPELSEMLGNALEIGGVNLKVMELLDTTHTTTFGHPIPTQVTTIPTEGKCILISGHDLADCYQLLKSTENTGINIYTHGEMLPAHAYPELQKFKHLRGHYGRAWQLQKTEFQRFPGPILLTSNCLIEPLPSYKSRVFTTNSVGFNGVKHISDCHQENAFAEIIRVAQESRGFLKQDCQKSTSTREVFEVGYGHQSIFAIAEQILQSLQSGQLKDIFVIGGCDGSENSLRSYYTELARNLPATSIALTLGCGKYRVNGLDEMYQNNNNNNNNNNTILPRLLDLGQCNDSYSAVKVALALKEILQTPSVNDLPLHFAVSWFEQKAVAVLLTLLHLNIQKIYLGPYLPAFLTPNILKILIEKFDIRGINSQDPRKDLQEMLQKNSK